MLSVFCVRVEETGPVKNYLGECSLTVTHPDGEFSEILVSNTAEMQCNDQGQGSTQTT